MANIAVINRTVAHGRVTPSAVRPGISPGRRRPSRGWRAVAVRARRPRVRRRGSRGVPALRSIFGARLRTRCPQYGHSVTYGLTSDPQFLQTTNRSGCDTQIRGYPRGNRGRKGPELERRLLDDLGHDLAEVVVRLVDDQLASATVATVEDVLETV